MADKKRIGRLFPHYGDVLTEAQRDMVAAYLESRDAQEVAEKVRTTKQNVYNTLKNSAYKMEKLEAALGLAWRAETAGYELERIKEDVVSIRDNATEPEKIDALCQGVLCYVDCMEAMAQRKQGGKEND